MKNGGDDEEDLTDPGIEPAGQAAPGNAQPSGVFVNTSLARRNKEIAVSMKPSDKQLTGNVPQISTTHPTLLSNSNSARPAGELAPGGPANSLLTGAREDARATSRRRRLGSTSSDEGPVVPRASENSRVNADATNNKNPFCSADVDTTVKLQEKAVVSIYDEIGKVQFCGCTWIWNVICNHRTQKDIVHVVYHSHHTYMMLITNVRLTYSTIYRFILHIA
jgi:hypothetical protein